MCFLVVLLQNVRYCVAPLFVAVFPFCPLLHSFLLSLLFPSCLSFIVLALPLYFVLSFVGYFFMSSFLLLVHFFFPSLIHSLLSFLCFVLSACLSQLGTTEGHSLKSIDPWPLYLASRAHPMDLTKKALSSFSKYAERANSECHLAWAWQSYKKSGHKLAPGCVPQG